MLVKLWLGDDCRRVKYNDTNQVPLLEEIIQKAAELFGLTDPIQLKYKDMEGDLITLTGQEDFEDILASDFDSAHSLKLYIHSKLTPPPPEYIHPLLDVPPTNVTRSRFEASYTNREMLEILRDISIYICSRDLTPPGIRSWVSAQKNLVTPENAYRFDSRPIYPRVTRTKLSDKPLDKKSLLNRKVQSWTIDQVTQWLIHVGFEDLVPLFQAQYITGKLLLDLDNGSLKELGLTSAGRRMKLLKRISQVHQVLSSRHESTEDSQENVKARVQI